MRWYRRAVRKSPRHFIYIYIVAQTPSSAVVYVLRRARQSGPRSRSYHKQNASARAQVRLSLTVSTPQSVSVQAARRNLAPNRTAGDARAANIIRIGVGMCLCVCVCTQRPAMPTIHDVLFARIHTHTHPAQTRTRSYVMRDV